MRKCQIDSCGLLFSFPPTPFHFAHVMPLRYILGLDETFLVFRRALISFSEKLAERFPSAQLRVPRSGRLGGLLAGVNLLREEKLKSERGWPVGLILPSFPSLCVQSFRCYFSSY